MENLELKLSQIHDNSTFSRVDADHNLDLYIGYDDIGQITFLILSFDKPPLMSSSKLIEIAVNKRLDGRIATSFSLKDISFKDIFLYFLNEVIESSRDQHEQKGYQFVFSRIKKWQMMLRDIKPSILSNSEIKGLLGELIVLDKVVASEIGYNSAVKGWIGSDGSKQDFVLEQRWIEVKSTTTGNDVVTINGIEQLDSEHKGSLMIVYLDKSSEIDEQAITLNGFINCLTKKIDNLDVLDLFQSQLIKRGYFYDRHYDLIRYKVGKVTSYEVTQSFPCLRRKDLPLAIHNCKYELSLALIKEHEGGLNYGIS